MNEAGNLAAELTLDIDRGDTRTLAVQLTTGVLVEVPFDLSGSVFELLLNDAQGVEVLKVAGITRTGYVTFPMTLLQKRALKAGKSGLFELARTISGNREVLARGNTNIRGLARG